MTIFVLLLVLLVLGGLLALLVRELRRDGYGLRQGPRSCPPETAWRW
jgi:hypothetical protein